MKQGSVGFTDEEVTATLTALNDFITRASKRKQWNALPESEKIKYSELVEHAVSMHDKLLLIYAQVKREFN